MPVRIQVFLTVSENPPNMLNTTITHKSVKKIGLQWRITGNIQMDVVSLCDALVEKFRLLGIKRLVLTQPLTRLVLSHLNLYAACSRMKRQNPGFVFPQVP